MLSEAPKERKETGSRESGERTTAFASGCVFEQSERLARGASGHQTVTSAAINELWIA